MKLTILGYNSAIPTADSHPTSQLLEIGGKLILIDCGEGTQVQLRKAKAKFSRIDHIFISHMHGDHVFGLVGLISTFQLLGRTKPMHIFGPKGIKNFIENQLEHTRAYPTFPLDFKELESLESQLILETKNFTVHTIPLSHRIYTNGYLFKEKPKPRKLNVEAVKSHSEIEICDYENLKAGKDFILKNGNIIPNEELTLDPEPPKSYAFMSDTMYQPSAIPIIEEVDWLYHEATFLDNRKDLAEKTGHSTALQAATIAQKAKVKNLIIGHFSNRYKDPSPLKEEAETVFSNVYLPEELKTYEL